ncbi:MAG: hypothetical protein H6730_14485 [Deltaproteobacteria bacterium]|nr:hypothetical protein [Deltaproteobacteria bacterium]
MSLRAIGLSIGLLLAGPGVAAAQVEGWPAQLDFGLSPPDCPGVQALIGLQNAGAAPLALHSARFEGAGFLALDPAPAFPLTVAPGGRVSFGIRLVSPLDGPWAADLVLETSEGPLTSHLHGVVASEVTDRFAATPRPKVDLLLVIDDAPSMQQEQEGLQANLRDLLALHAQLDGHVGVITPSLHEGGRLRALPSGARFVRTSDPGYTEEALQLADVGSAGTGDRLGLWALREALTTHADGDNAGFLRADAALSVLLVSDADDLSPGTVDAYVDALRAIKGASAPNMLDVGVVASWGPAGCSGVGGDARPTPRYKALANATSGVVQDVCAEGWRFLLEARCVGLESRFWLSSAPVPGSLEVSLSGQRVPRVEANGFVNWTYDDGAGVIDFVPYSVPTWEEQLEVRYRPRACVLARSTGS